MMYPGKEDVEAFKNELKNKKYYEKKIKETNEKISLLEYEMGGVKGVNFSKQRSSHNPSLSEQRKLEMIEKKEILEKRKKEWERKLKSIKSILDQMANIDRSIIEKAYVDGVRYRDLCEMLGYKNTSTLFNVINNIILEAIKKAGR